MLRYIFGLPGSGKTTLCARELIAAQEGDGGERVYIVPEQFSLSSERLLLRESGGRGLFRAQAQSFNRLAYGVFRETGRGGKTALEDIGKSLVLRKVVNGLAGRLKYYKSKESVRSKGFIENIGRLITEFHQYGVTPSVLDGLVSRADAGYNNAPDASLAMRLADLSAIYRQYLDFVWHSFVTDDETLDALADRIPESRFLSGADVWIDGFKSFTPQEYRVIAALMSVCGTVSVALPLEPENRFDGYFTQYSPYDPFAEVKSTVNRLTRLSEDCGIRCRGHVYLREQHRYAGFPAMAHLVRHYFAHGAVFHGDADGIYIAARDDVYDEIDYAARRITELTRDHGYRYREIGVVLSDMDLYDGKLRHAFGKFGIPVFMDRRGGLLSHPLAEICRAALSVVSGGFTYENVFRALKTGLAGFAREDVDSLENYVLACGITRGGWEREWRFGFADGAEAASMNALRIRVLAFFAPLTDGLAKRGRRTAAQACAALYDFLVCSGVKAALEAWMDEARVGAWRETYQQHAQTWARLMDILDKTVEILGDEPVSAAELRGFLETGLESVSAGLAPPTLDHVTVGEASRSRLTEVRALFVLGVNEGLMPAAAAAEGLLSDADRETMRAAGVALAGTLAAKAADERLNIYQLLAKPTERLYLSYVKSDAAGKPARPSRIINDILKKIPCAAEGRRSFGIDDVTVAAVSIDDIAARIRQAGGEPSGLLLNTYRVLTGDARYAARAGLISGRANADKYRLSARDTAALYGAGRHGARIRTSVTRLESYINCPFMYYSRHVLGLKERKHYDIERYDVGNILHLIIERYTKRMLCAPEPIGRAELAAIADEAAAECMNQILLSSGRYKHVKQRLFDAAARSAAALEAHLRAGAFRVESVERVFEGETAVAIDFDGGVAELSGRVDRVDMWEHDGVKYLRVVDYKSGTRTFRFADVCAGLQLQLPVYLMACLNLYGNAEPAAALIFNIANHFLEYVKGLTDGAYNELLKMYRMSGAVTADVNVVTAMDAGIEGKSHVLPVSLSGGRVKNGVGREGFNALLRAAEEKIAETCRAILSGDMPPVPLRQGNKTACAYCAYNAVCGHDAENGLFRRLKTLGEREAAALFT